MKNLLLSILVVLPIFVLFSCGDDQDDITLTSRLANLSMATPMLGTYYLEKLQLSCPSASVVVRETSDSGNCLEQYCFTGSTLDIKKFSVPGYFEYEIQPPAPKLNAGDNILLETHRDFSSNWGPTTNGLITSFGVPGQEVGETCTLRLFWERE